MQGRRPGSGSRGGDGGSTRLVLMGWALHLPYSVLAGRWGSISASPFTGAQEAISPRKPRGVSFLSHQPLRGLDSLGLAAVVRRPSRSRLPWDPLDCPWDQGLGHLPGHSWARVSLCVHTRTSQRMAE